MSAKVIYVLDYAAMGRKSRPRRLHRTDCWHPLAGAKFRRATQQELRTLPVCHHCAPSKP